MAPTGAKGGLWVKEVQQDSQDALEGSWKGVGMFTFFFVVLHFLL